MGMTWIVDIRHVLRQEVHMEHIAAHRYKMKKESILDIDWIIDIGQSIYVGMKRSSYG